MDKERRTELAIYRGYERRLHAKLVREIELLVEPHFHKTGYVGDDDEPLLAVFFPEHKGTRVRVVRGGRTLHSVLGFVQGGVADDQWVALSTRDYDTLLIDDLVALLSLARKLAAKLRGDQFKGVSRREEKGHTGHT